MRPLLLITLTLCGCTHYHNETESFTMVGTNLGIKTNEDARGDSNAGFGAGGSSLLGVGSNVVQEETSTPPSIQMASGALITGTIDQTSSVSSIGSSVERVTFMQEWRKVFSRMFDSIDSAVDANVAKNSTDASVEKANIDAGVKETAILNPIEEATE